jgi:hypothetical protein
LIALAKQPRGFAIGGVAVGLLGTVLWVAAGMMGLTAYKFGKPMFETMADLTIIRPALDTYARQNSGAAAPDLATAGISGAALTDAWGSPYDYSPGTDGKSWTLTILGPDMAKGTSDDAVIASTMTDRDLQKALEPMMEAAVRTQIGAGTNATISKPIDPATPETQPTDPKPVEPATTPAGGAPGGTGGGGS